MRLLFILLLSFSAFGANYEACKRGNNYLEKKITNFLEGNPTFRNKCVKKEGKTFSSVLTKSTIASMESTLLSVDPISKCMLKVMKNGPEEQKSYVTPSLFKPQGKRHFVNCSSPDQSPPTYTIKAKAKDLIEYRWKRLEPKLSFYHTNTRDKYTCSPKTGATSYKECQQRAKEYEAQKKQPVDKYGKSKTIANKPCISKNYHKFVYESFTGAMQCLNFNQKDRQHIFSYLAHEASFMVNQVSHTQAVGVGQLTSIAVKQVNIDHKKCDGGTCKLSFKNSTSDSCNAIKKTLNSPLGNAPNTCSRASIPQNPLKNFIYAGLLHKRYKRIAKECFKNIYNKEPTSTEAKKIVRELTTYMYNGGEGTLKSLSKSFVGYPKDFNAFKEQFYAHVKNKKGNGAEVTNYPKNVRKKMKGLGSQCIF